ncbi:MAG: PorV/PorQ family protein [bacterium]
MSSKGFKSLFFQAVLLIWAFNIFAVVGTGGSAVPFLSAGVGARALSLSGAFTAYSDDPTCAYWNPAGLAFISRPSFSSMFSWMSSERKYNFFGIAYPTQVGAFALSFINFSIDSIEGRTSDTESFYTFSDNENAYILSYGKDITKNFSVGAAAKIIQIGLEKYDAYGVSFDMGFIVKPTDFLSFGGMFRDLGGRVSWSTGYVDTIPFDMRFGFLLDVLDKNLRISVEGDQNEFEGMTFKTGVEGAIFKLFLVRGGVSYGARSYEFNYTLGVGIKYTLSTFAFALDYAFIRELYLYDTGLQGNHRLSLNVFF